MGTLIETLANRFPLSAAKGGEWAPIYLEPIPGSGERLTVLVAARAHDGDFALLRTLDAKRAKCMYGEHAGAMEGLIDIVAESLRALLASGLSLREWNPPLRDTVALGPISPVQADAAEEMARTGAMLAASLAVSVPLETIVATPADAEDDGDGDEWARHIREGTVRVRREFAPRFSQKVELRRGVPATRIGYFGERLAAQFGRLIPGRGLTNSRNRAKAYLTDLQILRDLDREGFIPSRPHYELMLWLPTEDSPAYTATAREEARGAFGELEAFGDKHELRVRHLRDANAAVQRILQAEAAP